LLRLGRLDLGLLLQVDACVPHLFRPRLFHLVLPETNERGKAWSTIGAYSPKLKRDLFPGETVSDCP
jgi:hypothetical protein